MRLSVNLYEKLWERLRERADAPSQAVGGDFEAMGRLEFELLRHSAGLSPQSTVIDVGCGSGRLAAQLAPWLHGDYLGTDVLPDLLAHASRLCGRPDWQFVQVQGTRIPAPDNWADIVCFFSVFTHLPHEDSFRYLVEAARVLRPGGRLVCSFLEFRIHNHWAVFQADLADSAVDKMLNQFLSRDAFEAFAHCAGLKLETFFDGDKPHIPIDRELVFESGHRIRDLGNLGQSVCILRKP